MWSAANQANKGQDQRINEVLSGSRGTNQIVFCSGIRVEQREIGDLHVNKQSPCHISIPLLVLRFVLSEDRAQDFPIYFFWAHPALS